MKALLICSLHALFDISALERRAFNTALGAQSVTSALGEWDHRQILETTTMLELINRVPGDTKERELLTRRYLEVLNDLVMSAEIEVYRSVFDALLDPRDYARPKGFVSEYPLLTTNLARAAALLSNATKLGRIVAPLNILERRPVEEGLAAFAQSLNVPHDEVEVLVARSADFEAARSIGMRPKFIKEAREKTPSAEFSKAQHPRQGTVRVDTQLTPLNHECAVGLRAKGRCGLGSSPRRASRPGLHVCLRDLV